MAKRKRAESSFPKRPRSIRQLQQAILIVCEGIETEPNYFQSLKQELRLQSVDIQIVRAPVGVLKLVERAKEVQDIQTDLVKTQRRMGDPQTARAYDEVWCVFDRETERDNPDFHKAIQKALQYKFLLAVSNPTFEIWYLLHFQEKVGQFSNAEKVKSALRKHIPNYRESSDVYKLLIGERDNAITRAERLATQVNDENPYPNPFIYRGLPFSETLIILTTFFR